MFAARPHVQPSSSGTSERGTVGGVIIDTNEPVAPSGTPLERLYEREGLPSFALPSPLASAYGGGLGFREPCLVANFVASVDGVVALPVDDESGHVVSGSNEADRFVMGLLRACADAVLVGATTFRKAGAGARFDAEAIYPRAASSFAELRRVLGLPPRPRFVVATQSGDIDASSPSLEDAWIVTSGEGAARLRGRVPERARLIALGADLRLSNVVNLLREDGARVLLTEGGPSLFAELLAEALVDEIFVTTSPALFGRFSGDGRKALTDGRDLGGQSLELVSVRRHGEHLFSRYRVASPPSSLVYRVASPS